MPTAEQIENLAKKLVADEKYFPTATQTYCNFFVRDFGEQLLGAPVPELQGRAKQQAAQLADASLDPASNWQSLGLRAAAGGTDKVQLVFENAQKLANAGMFIVAAAKAPAETPAYSGHVGVIVPSREKDGGLAPKSGTWGVRCPWMAQAGSSNFDYKTLSLGFGKKFKNNVLELFAFKTPSASPGAFLGGFDLQIGDNDSASRWGGQVRPGSGNFVSQLQALLKTLGFLIGGNPDGNFGRKTDWAVREFQIYASAPKGAIEVDGSQTLPHNRLSQIDVPTGDRYDSNAIHGVVTGRVRELLEKWGADERRCPIVLVAFKKGTIDVVAGNIWTKSDCDTKPRVFAFDISGLFSIPGERLVSPAGSTAPAADKKYVNVGKFTSALSSGMLAWPTLGQSWVNAGGLPAHAEVLPDNLIGKTTATLTEAEKSTFRVIRSVAEVECMGFFDCLNAYDPGFMSAGLYHWIIALGPKTGQQCDAGELGGYAAYLKAHDTGDLKDGFRDCFERFGVGVQKDWVDTGVNLLNKSQLKYTNFVTQRKLDPLKPLLVDRSVDAEYFATWHWFYRLQMASRTLTSFQRGMWDFCRLRIRDILASSIRKDAEVDPVPITGGTRPATLGDVFRSEKSIAILLRCHVNGPAYIVSGGSASSHITEVIKAARAAVPAEFNGSPTGWQQGAEDALITALLDRAKTKLSKTIRDTVPQVDVWPQVGDTASRSQALEDVFSLKSDNDLIKNGLGTARDFTLADDGLPTAPINPPSKEQTAIQIAPPVFDSGDANEIGMCLKDDGAGNLESIFLQFHQPGTPASPAAAASDPSQEEPPPVGGSAPDPISDPIPVQAYGIEIPLTSNVPLPTVAPGTSQGSVPIQTPSGQTQTFQLFAPADGTTIDNVKATLDLGSLLGAPGSTEIQVLGEVLLNGLTFSGGVPTAGSAIVQIRITGTLLPRDLIWRLAATGDHSNPTTLNLKKFAFQPDGTLRLPFKTSGSSDELPLPVDEASWTVEGETVIGPSVKNQGRYRIVFNATFGGSAAVNLGSGLAQCYLRGYLRGSEVLEIRLDTDNDFSIRISDDQVVAGVRLDLFDDFRNQAVVNNQWLASSNGDALLKNHLIKAEKSLDGLFSDIEIRWQGGLPRIPITLLSFLLDQASTLAVNTGRQLQSLGGRLLAGGPPMKVNFAPCPSGLLQTNLGRPTAVATLDQALVAGQYELLMTWVADPEHGDAVPVDVRAGGMKFRGFVNQQVEPEAALGVVIEGRPFELVTLQPDSGGAVTSFAITSTDTSFSLTVGNGAAGKTVVDGIALRRGATVQEFDDQTFTFSTTDQTTSWSTEPSGFKGNHRVVMPARLRPSIEMNLCLRVNVNGNPDPVFIGEGQFEMQIGTLPTDANGDVIPNARGDVLLSPSSFKCLPTSKLTIVENDFVSKFGPKDQELVSLSIPKDNVFTFTAIPGRNEFKYEAGESAQRQAKKIRVRIPAHDKDMQNTEEKRFTFEMDEFGVHSGGIDLRGRVINESVSLGKDTDTALKEPVNVEGPKKPSEKPNEFQVGEIAFRDSRLIYTQVRAAGELAYFDDGYGVFTLTVSENEDRSWDIIGDLDITGHETFKVEDLYTTFGITRFVFTISYDTGTKIWTTDGAISGYVKFEAPKGKSSSSAGALSDLFGKKVEVRFEDWHPLDLTLPAKLTIEVEPKHFEVAKILDVSLRGLEITPRNADGGLGPFKLLGDVKLKKIPGINANLTFGGIEITPASPVPQFKIDEIGAELTIPGSFTAGGKFRQIKDDREQGFEGSFSLKTNVLPPINGVVALTSLRTISGDGRVPSLAIYLEAGDLEVALFSGFYLRALGFGLGINRGLRGLMPEPGDDRKLSQRLIGIVNDPRGLPNPSQLRSWVPAAPDSVRSRPLWMFVANGLITFGNQPSNQSHTMAGSALLSINYEGEIFLGVNLWLFTSPEETRQSEFQERPVARGGILISPKERSLFGMFTTVKNPAIGKDSPELLADVLNAVETSMMFQADANGFLLEVGWPWETRIQKQIGPLYGELTSGFRFGIYRGIVSFGLNWAILIRFEAEKKVDFSTRIGSAEARLRAFGEGNLRVSFVGALDHGLQPYLVGDVRVSATVQLIAEAECRLSKKIGPIKIKLKISFRESLDISINAALTMSLNPQTELGLTGSAHVSVSVCGYRLSGNVEFSHQADRIEVVRQRIQELLPPPLDPSATPSFSLQQASALAALAIDTHWTYLFRRVEIAGVRTVRVLLFPSPGVLYPTIESNAAGEHFELRLKPNADFQGFIGKQAQPITGPGSIAWSEHLDQVIISAQTIRDNPDDYLPEGGDWGENILLRDLLQAMSGSETAFDPLQPHERVDQRPWNPSPEHSDDPAAQVSDSNYHSPFIKANTEYDQSVALASGDRVAERVPDPTGGNGDGMPSAMLLNELMNLMNDEAATVPSTPSRVQRLAPNMKLVLSFVDPTPVGQNPDPKIDPVRELIDFGTDNKPLKVLVDGQLMETELRASYQRDGNPTPTLPEYDLVVGPTAQANDRICLNWELWREQSTAPTAERKIAYHYAELLEYRVERRIAGSAEKPKLTRVRPAFLDATDADKGYLRPQFQFVDEDVTNLRENDLILYRVEAWSPDRRLARTTITAQRRRITILSPIRQSLALHRVPEKRLTNSQAKNIEFTVLNVQVGTDTATVPAPTPVTRSMLRLQFRIVPASKIGLYGRADSPTGKTSWSRGVAGRSVSDFDIKFANPTQTFSIPWQDTKPFTVQENQWTELRDLTGAVLGFSLNLSERAMTDLVEQQNGALHVDDAIEFYIGTESIVSNEPLQRSPLVKCRHAIAGAPSTTATTDVAAMIEARLTEGNTVFALEQIRRERQVSFVPPNSIRVEINYGTYNRDSKENPNETQEPKDPKTRKETHDGAITVCWPHDGSHTGDASSDGAVTVAYDPVVGYRVHLVDALDVNQYPLPQGADPRALHLGASGTTLVNVVTNVEYRARPASILVAGISLTAVDADGREVIETDWNLVGEPLNISQSSVPETTSRLKLLNPDHGTLKTPVESYLENDLCISAAAIARQLAIKLGTDVFVRFRPAAPVLPNAEQPLSATDTIASRFERFAAGFDWSNDPYGWIAAEAMGLSCECTFEHPDGRVVPAEDIRKIVEAGIDGQANTHRVQAAFFQADDGQTLLDVVRLTSTVRLNNPPKLTLPGPKPPGPNPVQYIREEFLSIRVPLLYQLGAIPSKLDPSKWTVPEAAREQATAFSKACEGLEGIRPQVEVMLNRVGSRLESTLPIAPIDPNAPKVTRLHNTLCTATLREQRELLSESQSLTDAGRASLTIPLRDGELLKLKLPLPDRWAHHYRIAIETVRRYDHARLLAGGYEPELQRTDPVPSESVRYFNVRRSKSLVGLNLFATPLPGSIQAAVFRHVASFAGTSNAEQKARGEVGPTSIFLERRIVQEEKQLPVFDHLPTRVGKDKETFWKAYQVWLTNEGHLDTTSNLPLISAQATSDGQRLNLEIPKKAAHGIYGADRYVVPDVPPNYAYRFSAQTRAGIVRSPVCSTAFVMPLFDSKDDPEANDKPRMQPRGFDDDPFAEAPTLTLEQIPGATETAFTLTLSIPLIYSRLHMRRDEKSDLRPLWVKAEQPLVHKGGLVDVDLGQDPQGADVSIGFGSLPDLFARYQFLVLQNYRDLYPPDQPNDRLDKSQVPVLVPMFEIIPPDLSTSDSENQWFTLEKKPVGIEWLDQPITGLPLIPTRQLASGAIVFDVKLQFVGEDSKAYLDPLRIALERHQEDGLRQAIRCTITREGKVSDLIPPLLFKP